MSLFSKLVSGLNDATRQVVPRGNQVIVPLKYDEEGRPVKAFHLYRRLNLLDLELLDKYRELDWDFEAAAKAVGIPEESWAWRKKKLEVFQEEDRITRSKARIPGPAYVMAKDLDNLEGLAPLEDSQHKSLDRLAKSLGMFKTAEVNITQNVFNLPKLTPEIEAEFKQLAEKALEAEVVP